MSVVDAPAWSRGPSRRHHLQEVTGSATSSQWRVNPPTRDLPTDGSHLEINAAAVKEAVKGATPEVVIHKLTGLAAVKSFKNFDEEFAMTRVALRQLLRAWNRIRGRR
jgi:hypothetical protein